jgi:hypothetical protein
VIGAVAAPPERSGSERPRTIAAARPRSIGELKLKGLAADFGGYVELGDGTALSARGRGRWRWARATAIDARARSARKQPHDRVRPARR